MPPPLSRILLVEDEPDLRTVARMALEALGGFTVACCASGEEALARAAGFGPDLILLDVMLPGLDGPATLARLRADPATAAVPVVFLTGRVAPGETGAWLALGALGVIPKPFDPLALPDRLRRMLEEGHGH